MQVQKLCAQTRVDSQARVSDNGFLVDLAFIGTGLSRVVSYDDYLQWMLVRRLSYLEIPYTAMNSQWEDSHTVANRKPFVRLSLQEAGHTTCAEYSKWVSKYPAQRLPWVRRSGVSDNLCIGFEPIDTPRSRYEVRTTTTLIEATQNQRGLERYDFSVRDRLTGAVTNEATLAISTEWEHRDILCRKQPVFDEFVSALVPIPDSRYATLKTVLSQAPDFNDGEPASDRMLTDFRWNNSVGRDNVTNIVSRDGNVWVESIYDQSPGRISLRGFHLVFVVGNSLLKTPIIRGGQHVQWLTGLGFSDTAVAIIAVDEQTSAAELLIFTRSGVPVAAHDISREQLEALKAKP